MQFIDDYVQGPEFFDEVEPLSSPYEALEDHNTLSSVVLIGSLLYPEG
jgi:hypothetical protein